MDSSDSYSSMKSYPDLQFETDSPPPPSPESEMEVTSDDTYHLSTDSSSSTDSWTMDESPDDMDSHLGLWEVVDRGEALFDLGAAPRAAHRLKWTKHQRICHECRWNI